MILVTRDRNGKLVGPGSAIDVEVRGVVEQWVVAVVHPDGDASWAGWPEGRISPAGFTLHGSCQWSSQQVNPLGGGGVIGLLGRVADIGGSDHRAFAASLQLAKLGRARRLAEWGRRGWGMSTLREANVARLKSGIFNHEPWTPAQWAVAAAGEVGEFLNAIKKFNWRRDGNEAAVVAEAADVVIYLDLMLEAVGQIWDDENGGDLCIDLFTAQPDALRPITRSVFHLWHAMASVLDRTDYASINGANLGGDACDVVDNVVKLLAQSLGRPMGLAGWVLDTFNATSAKRGSPVSMPLNFDPLADMVLCEGEWRVVDHSASWAGVR